jgi:hypothetical protein
MLGGGNSIIYMYRDASAALLLLLLLLSDINAYHGITSFIIQKPLFRSINPKTHSSLEGT